MLRKRLPAAIVLLSLVNAGWGQDSSSNQDPLRQHYVTANALLARGNTDGAAVEFRAFLAEALHRVANAQAQIGETSKSASLFAQAVELKPDDSALLNDYAAMRFDEGRLSEAETLLNSALALHSNDPWASFLLGRVLFSQEKYLAAKPHLELAFSNDPRAAWFSLAVTDLKLQQLSAVQDLLAKVIAMLGNKATTHFRMGLAYYTGDYPDEAIGEFKKATALDPKALDQHYYLGLAYLGHNPEAGFKNAEPEFRTELSLSPNDFRSHYMLGYVALKQNRMKEAEQELVQARVLKADDMGTLLLTAELYSSTDRDKDAEPVLRKAIALAGGSSLNYEIIRAHYMLGRILQHAGSTDEAAKELAISEELRQKFRAAFGSTPKEHATPTPRGTETDEKPRIVSPEERARAETFIHEISPAIAEAFNNLGAIAANQKECPSCVSYFRRAGEWDAALQGLDRNLGRAAFLCENYEAAIAALSRFLQQHPDDVTVRSELGLSFFQRGNYDRVLEVLQPIKSSLASSPELSRAYATALTKTGQNQN